MKEAVTMKQIEHGRVENCFPKEIVLNYIVFAKYNAIYHVLIFFFFFQKWLLMTQLVLFINYYSEHPI